MRRLPRLFVLLNHELTRVPQTSPSRECQESVKSESAQISSGDDMLKHIGVDAVEQTRNLPTNDARLRRSFEKCGLTPAQQVDAVLSLGISEIVEPTEPIKQRWKCIPPYAPSLSDHLQPVIDFIRTRSHKGDFLLVQGDFGAVYLLVQFALDHGLHPIYSTTEREVVETAQARTNLVERWHFPKVEQQSLRGRHIEQTPSLPALETRSRNSLEECGLRPRTVTRHSNFRHGMFRHCMFRHYETRSNKGEGLR